MFLVFDPLEVEQWVLVRVTSENFSEERTAGCQDHLEESSQARVTSKKSFSSRRSLKAVLTLDSKSFHRRQNFSEEAILTSQISQMFQIFSVSNCFVFLYIVNYQNLDLWKMLLYPWRLENGVKLEGTALVAQLAGLNPPLLSNIRH